MDDIGSLDQFVVSGISKVLWSLKTLLRSWGTVSVLWFFGSRGLRKSWFWAGVVQKGAVLVYWRQWCWHTLGLLWYLVICDFMRDTQWCINGTAWKVAVVITNYDTCDHIILWTNMNWYELMYAIWFDWLIFGRCWLFVYCSVTKDARVFVIYLTSWRPKNQPGKPGRSSEVIHHGFAIGKESREVG